MERNRFSSWIHGEAKTGGEQLLSFTCHPDDRQKVEDFLKEKVRSVDIPHTKCVNIAHGGYGQYSRYDIAQHKYAGGGTGFIEVLEIRNAPDGRHSVVVHEYTSNTGYIFTEFELLEQAVSAFERFWSGGPNRTSQEFPKVPGFIRRIVCGPATPWFYAIGDEALLGDYAFPDGMQDDPVFKTGKYFVVDDYEEGPRIKMCLGTRLLKYKRSIYDHANQADKYYRLVYWDDGTTWTEDHSAYTPRDLKAGEEWIVEAQAQFLQILTGRLKDFEINFIDGTKFVGKIVEPKAEQSSPEGDYYGTVHIDGESKPRDGWVRDFKPTREIPTIQTYIMAKMKDLAKKVIRIDIKESNLKRKGKKWKGVFFKSPYS